MALDPLAEAALKGAAPMICVLLQIELPEHTLRLTDGSAEIAFGGHVFAGEDPIYGRLDHVDSVREQTGTEAPRFQFRLIPESVAAMAAITAPGVQGAAVQLWCAVLNPHSGTIIGAPEPLFVGELDEAIVDASDARTAITLDAASAWDRFFEDNEGLRLNPALFASYWPGALGGQYITQIQRQLPWNTDAPRPNVVSDFNSGGQGMPGYGGGGGRGGGGHLL